MQNKDFWSEDEVEKMYEKFLAMRDDGMTFVHWLYKVSADPALAYDIGQLVQVAVSGPNDGETNWKYGVVAGYDYGGVGAQVHYDRVSVRFADGGQCLFEVKRNPRCASSRSDTEPGDIRPADIPEDVVKLTRSACGTDLGPVKDGCPFKDEWKTPVPPCMKKGEKQ